MSDSSDSSPPPSREVVAFRGPAADSRLGELFLDVIGIVAAAGFAADVSRCLHLCGLTYRAGDRGAVNDMLVQSLRLQCGARAARAAAREDFADALGGSLARPNTTQLMRAAARGDRARARTLLALGAAADALDGEEPARAEEEGPGEGPETADRWSALMYAARRGDAAIVRALLAAGARAGRVSDRLTPLAVAALSGRAAAARVLLDAGADAAARCGRRGAPALHFCARVDYLQQGGGEEEEEAKEGEDEAEDGDGGEDDADEGKGKEGGGGGRPAHAAVARLLLARGADPDATDAAHGWTALMLAAHVGDEALPVLRALLRAGAALEPRDGMRYTALALAAMGGAARAVRALLRAGADPRARGLSGWSIARAARERGHASLAAELESAEAAWLPPPRQ